MEDMRLFASDNTSSVHPEVLRAMNEVNTSGHRISYGDDEFTESALNLMQELFGSHSHSWFVYNGTAANVIAIRSMLKPYQSVLAPATSHIEEDECGAIESMAGVKIEFLPQHKGKISADDIPGKLGRLGFVHSVQPGLVSITQSSEMGTRYRLEELEAIGKACSEHGLLFHMDGARIANAVAGELSSRDGGWSELSSAALTKRGREILSAMTLGSGVHALSLGATKNGIMFGEGIVLMNDARGTGDLPFLRKQNAQLASKMRYISAQFSAMFSSDIWLRNALHANELAQNLALGITELASTYSRPELEIVYPVEANAVFAALPHEAATELQTKYKFYQWDEQSYRLMLSWDRDEEDVSNCLSDLSDALEELS